jgi:glycosyltransferase involved in cell wall biosynthesis
MAYSISVIIPTHNRAHSVGASIESVFAQSVPVLEVLVVDDASSDDTVAVVREMVARFPKIRVIALAENGGGGHARNIGIDAAEGDYLAFLDSDDTWFPDKLEKQLNHLGYKPGAEFLCFTNLQIDYADGRPAKPWNTVDFSIEGGAKPYILEHDQVVQTSTWLISTAAARRVKFDKSLRRHQDIDFVLRAADLGVPFVYLPEVLVHYSADPAAVRTSQHKNARPSLFWMERARAYLSKKEIAQFYLKHVLDMELVDAPMKALSRCLCGVVTNRVGAVQTSRALARNILPERARKWFKRGA